LAFAEIAPARVRCYPLTTQVAEKLHTYTRTYASGETSPARDLADILLAASVAEFNGLKLKQAIDATFKARASHSVPHKCQTHRTASPRPTGKRPVNSICPGEQSKKPGKLPCDS
jgi:hypothetical protein